MNITINDLPAPVITSLDAHGNMSHRADDPIGRKLLVVDTPTGQLINFGIACGLLDARKLWGKLPKTMLMHDSFPCEDEREWEVGPDGVQTGRWQPLWKKERFDKWLDELDKM